ncbi:hypothetical protein BDZ89DRAFT_1044793 [Hymenopellis radicata]|nr:hypothetical protein BDZ89DRAFT_1044793 [Hymenopellis radicata]
MTRALKINTQTRARTRDLGKPAHIRRPRRRYLIWNLHLAYELWIGTFEDCAIVWVVPPSAADAPAITGLPPSSADVPTTDQSLSLLRMPPSFEVSHPSSPTSRSLTDLASPQCFVINAFNMLA